MRIAARDQEAFFYVISLLVEAGVDAAPVGGNELLLPDDTAVPADIHTEVLRVAVVYGGNFVPVPPGGGDGGAPPAAGVAEQAALNRPAAPMPRSGTGGLGPTPIGKPPRTGPGSGKQEWMRYVRSLPAPLVDASGHPVADHELAGMARDQIIDLVEAQP
jgi:hypothetical protein